MLIRFLYVDVLITEAQRVAGVRVCLSLHVLGYICFLTFLIFLLDEENSLHVVVNCGEALLKNNTYWPLVSDFINILSHQSVAKKFLEDHRLLVTWMNFVSFFQGR